jgi:predicted RNA polymerase sigma factor
MDKIAALSEILKQNPADPFARYGLAMALAAEARNDDALAEYTTILEHTPDYVPAFQMSAQLLLKLSRTEEARTRLEAGLEAAQRTQNKHAQSELQAMLDDLGA